MKGKSFPSPKFKPLEPVTFEAHEGQQYNFDAIVIGANFNTHLMRWEYTLWDVDSDTACDGFVNEDPIVGRTYEYWDGSSWKPQNP